MYNQFNLITLINYRTDIFVFQFKPNYLLYWFGELFFRFLNVKMSRTRRKKNVKTPNRF